MKSEAVIPVLQIILAICAKFCIDQEKAVENFLNYDLLNVFILNAPLVWSVAQFQSSALGGCRSKPTQPDDWNWATDQRCI